MAHRESACPQEVADYIRAFAFELSLMAESASLHTIARLLQQAGLEAGRTLEKDPSASRSLQSRSTH
jgi:hypothetical protein